jgi:hypothetical protein
MIRTNPILLVTGVVLVTLAAGITFRSGDSSAEAAVPSPTPGPAVIPTRSGLPRPPAKLDCTPSAVPTATTKSPGTAPDPALSCGFAGYLTPPPTNVRVKPGMPAIKPSIPNAGPQSPAITVADVKNYVSTRLSGGLAAATTGTQTLVSVTLDTAAAIEAKYNLQPPVPATTLLYVAEIQGEVQVPRSGVKNGPRFTHATGCLMLKVVTSWRKPWGPKTKACTEFPRRWMTPELRGTSKTITSHSLRNNQGPCRRTGNISEYTRQ